MATVCPLRQLVRRGDATPDGNGVYDQFLRPALNENGQVSFGAFLSNTSGGSGDNRGIFRADGLTAPVQLVRQAAPAPDGDGSFSIAQDDPALNASGEGRVPIRTGWHYRWRQ